MNTPTLETYRVKLPHWRMDGSTYFVTWRLASAQRSLDHRERSLVADALKHFAGSRYDLFAYVVMDDHVHVLVASLKGSRYRKSSIPGNRLQPIACNGFSGEVQQSGRASTLIELFETKPN